MLDPDGKSTRLLSSQKRIRTDVARSAVEDAHGLLNNSLRCFQSPANWSAHKCAEKRVSTDGRKKAIGTRRSIVGTHRRTCAIVPETRFVFDYDGNEWRGTQCPLLPPSFLASILSALSCADTRGVTNASRCACTSIQKELVYIGVIRAALFEFLPSASSFMMIFARFEIGEYATDLISDTTARLGDRLRISLGSNFAMLTTRSWLTPATFSLGGRICIKLYAMIIRALVKRKLLIASRDLVAIRILPCPRTCQNLWHLIELFSSSPSASQFQTRPLKLITKS